MKRYLVTIATVAFTILIFGRSWTTVATAQVCDGPICQMMEKPAQFVQKAVQFPNRVVQQVRPDNRPVARVFNRIFTRRQNMRCEIQWDIRAGSASTWSDVPQITTVIEPELEITLATQTAAAQDDDLRSFRRAVNEMADRAVREGEINRLERMRVRFSLALPNVCREMKKMTEAELVLADPAYQGIIDWENFDVEKFRQVMEIILAFIKGLGLVNHSAVPQPPFSLPIQIARSGLDRRIPSTA